MKNSLYHKFYLLTARKRKGEHPIYCRISINREKAEFFTGYFCSPKNWNDEKERVKGNPHINAMLVQIENKLSGTHIEKIHSGIEVSAREMKDIYFGKDKSTIQLINYFDIFINEISTLPDQYSFATVKKYQTIQRHLKDFLDSIHQPRLLVTGFDRKNVNEFEYYLTSKAKLSTNTTTKYLKQLKALFNRAIKFGYLATNPFGDHRFKHQKTTRAFLSKEEVKDIEDLEIGNKSIERIKDCFLFSIYTGLRYSDVNKLTRQSIKKDRNGEYWLEFSIQKTKESSKIPLLDKARTIVEKYWDESEKTNRLLPIISNQKINTYLKLISELTGINKVLTFHVARHTFATTMTLSNKVPIEIVSKLLGHSNISSTQIYAKITNEYLSNTAKMLNQIL